MHAPELVKTISANTTVQTLAAGEPLVWPEQLSASGGFAGLDSWMTFARKVYGFDIYRLVLRDGDEIRGLLALCHVKHPIFGDYLTTAPFASYGGFAYSSEGARNALLSEARRLMHDLDVQYANVRFDAGETAPPEGWRQNPIYATYRVALRRQPEAMLAAYSSDHRNHIRKSLKKDFSIRFGHLELVHDAYEVLARSMHELGSPYHSRSYLRAMAEALGATLEFAVVYGPQHELAGAGVFITHGDVVTNLHANILRRFRADYAGEYLYWSVIARYGEQGYREFDLGRSLIGSGNETFKTKWKPRKQLLAYWYALKENAELPELNQKSARFQAAIWTWKRLPSFVVRPLGPFLIKGLA